MKNKILWIPVMCLLLMAGCTKQEETTAVEQGYDDQIGPYINMTTYDFTTVAGSPLDFSNITGYDDYDGLLSTKVEGYVDYQVPGDYYPSITCTDFSGNKTSIVITVHVVNAELHGSETAAPTEKPEEQPQGCDTEWAEEPGMPCGSVLDPEAEKYSMLFAGEEGLQQCITYSGNEKSCEAVKSNDGSTWGYGIRK